MVMQCDETQQEYPPFAPEEQSPVHLMAISELLKSGDALSH
jgi:hypothetical protein